MEKILDAPDNELIEALAETLKKAGFRELLIIVDGLWEGVTAWFVQFIMDLELEFKALLTSRYNSLPTIPDGMLCIEYDKEQQECLRSLQYDATC
ncbi:hypothetical protein BDD12DRAFT_884065 [Trichophaea hybrida]|nr:hypothetical protein BDD12DRAFT_884065 [Trichophaea hybrida]